MKIVTLSRVILIALVVLHFSSVCGFVFVYFFKTVWQVAFVW